MTELQEKEGRARREEKFVMVRVRKETHARLEAYRKRMEEWARLFPEYAPPFMVRDSLPLWACIEYLLYQHDCKRARKKASKPTKLVPWEPQP